MLHGGHVIHAFRHHACDFLEAREAVKLQRVERMRMVGSQHLL